MKFLRLPFVPFALAFILFIRWFSKYKLIRFGSFQEYRLGHLIGDTECYLQEKKAGLHPDSFDIFIPHRDQTVSRKAYVSNKVIARKYRKHLFIIPRWIGTILTTVLTLFSGWEKHLVQTLNLDRDIKGLWGEPFPSFTEAEEKKGQALLRSLGIPEGAKWVCIFARDSSYMKWHSPRGDYSHHDYRDSDISDFIPSAQELIARGYYVVRMGSIVAKPFHIKHRMVIDYPFTGKRSDFGDLYLGAKCEFAIGNHSGFMSIPQVFGRPIGITDYVPLEYTPTFAKGLFIWKHHYKNDKEMTFKEIIESGAGMFLYTHQYVQAGISLKNNTTREIYDLTMEMCNPSTEDQSEFWKDFPRHYAGDKPLHEVIKIRVCNEFLKAQNAPAGS